MKPQHAFCESADESSDEGRVAKRPTSRPPSNVAIKRSSQSSDLGRNNTAASDSGYSSRTAATKSSADSAKSSSNRRGSPVKADAPPAVPDAPTPLKARSKQTETSPRKSTHGREGSKSSKATKSSKPSKTAKPLIRQSSTREKIPTTTRSRRDSSLGQECRDPDCDRCQDRPRMRPPPLNTAVDRNYSAYPPQSPRVPSSPMRAPYGAEYPSVQTQVASSNRPRFYSQGRPTSYHGGSGLSGSYSSYTQFNAPYGPPPTMYNPQYAAMLGNTPPNGYYNPVPPSPLSASFEGRPQLPRGITDPYAPRQPSQALPNPRYAPSGLPAVSNPDRYEDDDSEEEDEEGYYRPNYADADRRAMAPPPIPSERPRRPSLRSHTTTDVRRPRPASIGYGSRGIDYEDDIPTSMVRSLQIVEPPRRPSITRSGRYHQGSSKGDGILVETARSDRPRNEEREKLRRNTMYNKTVVPQLRLDDTLRDREAKADDRKKNKLDNKMNMVEAYLSTTGANSYGAGIDNLRTKSSRDRAPSNGARTRTSSNSQHSHDDVSRVSDGSRSTSTRKTVKDGNLTVRMDGDDVTVEGDMGGKTLKITNGDDGNHQIIIAGDSRGRENKYLTEGSRVTTNTGSSRSRSERESARPRAISRSAYERALERHQRDQTALKREQTKRARRVTYVDDPERLWYQPQ